MSTKKRLNPSTVLLFTVLHILAALGIFFHTSAALLVFFLLYLITGFGVTVGYHRLLTHRGFKTTPFVLNLLATAGALSAHGGPLFWVSIHRQHHQFTELEADPHDSSLGFWWSHIGWLLCADNFLEYDPSYVSDLSINPWLSWLNRYFILLQLLLGTILFLVTYHFSGMYGAVSMFIWAIPLRFIAVAHSSWLTNSVAHLWGYRNFETSDNSTNSWWVAFLTLGEGWHNNHHAFPASSRHGLRRWELDPSWWFILFLRRFNLAWDIKSAKINP
jgi:sn-1 stearoyl-lipid 9-desaturase